MFNHHPVFQATMTLLLLILGPLALASLIIDDHLVSTERALRHPLVNGLSFCSLWPAFFVIIAIVRASFDTAYYTCYHLRSPEYYALAVNHLFKNIRKTLQRCLTALNSMLALIISIARNIPAVILLILQLYFGMWLATDSMLSSYFTAKDRRRSRPCSACGERGTVIGQLREDLEVAKEENKSLKMERARSCVRVAGVRRVVKLQKARIAALKNRLRVQELKGRQLQVLKGKVVELQEEIRTLKEGKASMKKELERSKEKVEVIKAEYQQLGEDLQSAKKTVETLTVNVTQTETSKEDEHTMRVKAESEVATLRAQVSSLGSELKEAKMDRVIDLLVLKKVRDGRVVERVAMEKVKEAHAEEIKDLRLQLVEAHSSADNTTLELEAAKQDKAAVQEELHHTQGQLTVSPEQNVALGTENKKLRQEIHGLRSNDSGTRPIDEDITLEGEANDSGGGGDADPLESLDQLENYFAAKDGHRQNVRTGGAEVTTGNADEHEEMVVSDEAENTLLNDTSDGSLIVEAKSSEDTKVMKEDSKTATEEGSSAVRDHNTPLVDPTTVKEESSAHDPHVCTSRCALVLPLPQASPPEVKPVPIYETPRPAVQPNVFPIVCPPSPSPLPLLVPLELPSLLTLGAVDVAAHDFDTASLLPQKKSRPRRRRRHGSKEGGGQETPTAAPVFVPAPSSSRSRRSHRPWFFSPKA